VPELLDYDQDGPWREFASNYRGVPFSDISDLLLQFKLTKFVCSFGLFNSINMAHLESIATSWPNVESLSLYSGLTSFLEVEALCYIASHLPKLTDLSICLYIDSELDPVSPPAFDHPLKSLTLHLENFEEPDIAILSDLVSHLDIIFPNLTSLTHLDDESWIRIDGNNDRPGSTLSQLHQLIRGSRERERKRLETRSQEVTFLRGRIQPFDLERLKIVGRRVRILTWEYYIDGSDPLVDSSVCIAVASALQGRFLLPNLQVLCWERPHQDSFPLLQLCLSPNLKAFELTADQAQPDEQSSPWIESACSIVHQLSDHQVQLSELRLDHSCFPTVLDVIPGSFPNLRTLHLSFNPFLLDSCFDKVPVRQFLQSLADLNHLEELHLFAPLGPFHNPAEIPNFRFQHLKSLSIGCWFREASQLLSMSQFPSLSQFSLQVVLSPQSIHDFDLNLLLGALGNSASLSSIRQLKVEPWRSQKDGYSATWRDFMSGQQGVAFQDIAQYLVQLKLTQFQFPFPIFQSFSLDNLKALAPNWRDMEFLSFYTAEAAQLGFDALHYIATNFPKLRGLAINLDAHSPIPRDTLPIVDHPLALMTLHLERFSRRMPEAADLASYLDIIFPNIVLIYEVNRRDWSNIVREHGRPGSIVAQIHRHIRAARYRDRQRAAGTSDYLRGSIKPFDLERLKLFGRRVRTLTCEDNLFHDANFDSSLCIAVASALQGQSLFPNLQFLKWKRPHQDSIALLQLCLSPRLKKFEVTADVSQDESPHWSEGACSIALQLAENSNQLSDLRLDHSCHPTVLAVIPVAFTHLRTLHLTLDPFNPDRYSDTDTVVHDLLQSLADISHLEELHLALEVLAVTHLPSLSAFSLHLIVPNHSMYDYDWNLLINALGKSAPLPRIRHLEVRPWPKQRLIDDRSIGVREFMYEHQGVPFQEIAERLFQLKLTKFHCPFPIFRSFSLGNLSTLVASWADIECLSFYTAEPAQFGLEALSYIASNVPKLRTLSINLYANLPIPGGIPHPAFDLNHPLTSLTLRLEGSSRQIPQVVNIASYLDTFFPNLTSITELDRTDWSEITSEYNFPGSILAQFHRHIKDGQERDRIRRAAATSVVL
ncbi:hypothetical protein CVT24_005084, partial [Panaeolus cyanescens]